VVTAGWICAVSKDGTSFEWKWPEFYKGDDDDDDDDDAEEMKDEDESKGERGRISQTHYLLQN